MTNSRVVDTPEADPSKGHAQTSTEAPVARQFWVTVVRRGDARKPSYSPPVLAVNQDTLGSIIKNILGRVYEDDEDLGIEVKPVYTKPSSTKPHGFRRGRRR